MKEIKSNDEDYGCVQGFKWLGKSIGIKNNGKADFAVLYSENVCNTAAVYTKNQIKGAPLYVTMENLKNGKAQSIVINSGCANVATGEQGLSNADKTIELLSKELGIKKENTLVASTGVIGRQLPMDKIINGIKGVKNELKASSDEFAKAIMTTDTFQKQVEIYGANFKILGIAKGAGMICPNMATMLAFIVTDAKIESESLQKMLKNSIDKSFNMVNVDMDTSTSDMAIVMANGLSGNVNEKEFSDALDYVCIKLAKMIARDGEGATKLIISDVNGANTDDDAKKIAKSIVNSNLIKCAIYGNDPNWGRIMCAIGNSQAKIKENKIKIWINNEPIVEAGKASKEFNEKKLSGILKDNEEITIKIDIELGKGKATAYGCDMTEEYVKINAEYMT